jgi:hypothetical protein
MEQAEFATRSTIFRGSRGINRILDSLGRFFLGIGAEAAPRRRDASERWWDREDGVDAADGTEGADALPMVLGEQARLFDDEGQVAVTLPETRVPEPERPVRRAAPRVVPKTVVSAQSRVNGKIVGITVTRAATLDTAAAKAVAVSVAPARAVAASRAIAQHLVMSRSIYSGPEVARRFSVPLRALRPHFQLFEGAAAVVEDDRGGIRLNQRELRTQRGQVWFV